jgi:hypothetical protein
LDTKEDVLMAYSEGYIVDMAKSDPALAEELRLRTHQPLLPFTELWMQTNPNLSETREVTATEIEALEDWIHGSSERWL